MYRELKLQIVTSSEDVASTHAASLSARVLVQQNHRFRETGGVSAGNRDQGFRPAFLDQSTGAACLSCFAGGCVAPFHVLDGLPDALITERGLDGQAIAVKDCVVAGFLRGGLFYTREQAARAVAH